MMVGGCSISPLNTLLSSVNFDPKGGLIDPFISTLGVKNAVNTVKGLIDPFISTLGVNLPATDPRPASAMLTWLGHRACSSRQLSQLSG